jgi:hypothetical protein
MQGDEMLVESCLVGVCSGASMIAWRATWPGLEELPNKEPRNGVGFTSWHTRRR